MEGLSPHPSGGLLRVSLLGQTIPRSRITPLDLPFTLGCSLGRPPANHRSLHPDVVLTRGRREAHASRRGKYLPAWVNANGGPPSPGSRLSPRVFTRRIARVEIADTAGPIPYSVIKKIIHWETG